MRPLREEISERSLILMGIPKKFANKTMRDVKDYGSKELREIKDFCSEYIDNIVENYAECRGIFFYGSNGVGKSFLSCIILREAYRHRYTCRRITFSSYISHYTEAWSVKDKDEKDVLENDFYENYKGVEFLVLEEIGKEIDTKVSTPILEDLLRYREEHGLVTIICSNLAPKTVEEKYGASIMSIIKGNTTPIKIVSSDKRQEVFNGGSH